MAVNVLDVGVVLYPEKEQRIVEVWKKVEPHIDLIRRFRNDVAFHANKNLRRYLETRGSFDESLKSSFIQNKTTTEAATDSQCL
jgi:hypothetical protein